MSLHHVADRLRALQVGCAVSGRLRGSVRRASGLVHTDYASKWIKRVKRTVSNATMVIQDHGSQIFENTTSGLLTTELHGVPHE